MHTCTCACTHTQTLILIAPGGKQIWCTLHTYIQYLEHVHVKLHCVQDIRLYNYVYHDNHAITFHNSCRETMCSGCNLRGTPPLTEGCGLQLLLLVAPLHSLSLRYPQAESVAVATGPHPLSLCSFSWAGLS